MHNLEPDFDLEQPLTNLLSSNIDEYSENCLGANAYGSRMTERPSHQTCIVKTPQSSARSSWCAVPCAAEGHSPEYFQRIWPSQWSTGGAQGWAAQQGSQLRSYASAEPFQVRRPAGPSFHTRLCMSVS
jgi:hypothetical protein